MDAELVGSSGMGFEFDAGDRFAVEFFAADDGVVGNGGFAVEMIDAHEGADIHVFADGGVDGA